MSDYKQQPTPKRRSSKAVAERKKLQRRAKYNAIGVARQQAIVAAVNIIHVDDEEVDLSDAFQFMDWYLANVEPVTGQGPVPESIVIEYRNNLLSLNLDGKNRREKIEFVMDVTRAPELIDVCIDLLKEPIEAAVDAVEEVPMIDFSEPSVDDKSIGTADRATTVCLDAVVEHKEATHHDDIINYMKSSVEREYCPVLMHDEAYKYEQQGNVNACHYVVHWKLHVFRELFISSTAFVNYQYELDRCPLPRTSVRVCTARKKTQHYLKRIFYRGDDPDSLVKMLIDMVTGQWVKVFCVSSGTGVITTGENGCCFERV